jgi:hypothetical protein
MPQTELKSRQHTYWLDHRDQCLDIFDTNKDEGSRLLGMRWVKANEKAVEVASKFGIPYTEPVFKALLSSLVLEIAKVLVPEKEVPDVPTQG